MIVLGRGGEAGGSVLGMGLAFVCALTWAGYSVLSRRLGEFCDGADADRHDRRRFYRAMGRPRDRSRKMLGRDR